MAAFACCFTIGNGLHLDPAGWSLSKCVTRPNRVHLHYGSRVRSAGLRIPRLLRAPPTLLYVEQAINIVPTFKAQDWPGLAWRTRPSQTKADTGFKHIHEKQF